MKFIAGLGNPGENYEKTRHNFGFRAVENFLEKNCLPKLKFNKKFNVLISEGGFKNEKIILAEPQAFMNNSGNLIQAISSYYKISAQDIWIVHDDLDIDLGKLRISQDRSSGGHKGVQSIINCLGTNDFLRFRLGIKPLNTEARRINVEKFVLQNFSKEEEKIVQEIIKKTVLALEAALERGTDNAMCEFN
jgi:PTH1 family peptidyl-tRNA hydrolase